MPLDTTLDGILNRRVMLEQPKQGFRVAVDTVLLAAAVPVEAGQRVLDLGCGVGGAMLALAARVAGIAVLGLEIQPELAALCRSNIMQNQLHSDLKIEEGNVADFTPMEPFHHVMINPPYHEAATHDVSANSIKRIANSAEGDLPVWLMTAAHSLAENGVLTLIHRADRADEIVDVLPPCFTEVHILEVLPKDGAAAKRVIVRAAKVSRASRAVTRCAPLVLHQQGGGYTEVAEAILRHIQPIPFVVS